MAFIADTHDAMMFVGAVPSETARRRTSKRWPSHLLLDFAHHFLSNFHRAAVVALGAAIPALDLAHCFPRGDANTRANQQSGHRADTIAAAARHHALARHAGHRVHHIPHGQHPPHRIVSANRHSMNVQTGILGCLRHDEHGFQLYPLYVISSILWTGGLACARGKA